MPYNHFFLSGTPYFILLCVLMFALVCTVFYYSLNWENKAVFFTLKEKTMRIYIPLLLLIAAAIPANKKWLDVKEALSRGDFIVSNGTEKYVAQIFSAEPKKKVRLKGPNTFYYGSYEYIYDIKKNKKLTDSEIKMKSVHW